MNRLKELRKEKGLTQKKFSLDLKIPIRTLQNWENGESNIKPNKAQQLERLQQIEQLGRLQQLERLNQIEQLTQLERLQKLKVVKGLNDLIQTTNYSYEHFSSVENSILYLDPPYENTKGYMNPKDKQKKGNTVTYQNIKLLNDFDSQKFYEWAFQMSKNNIVIISSYEISDPRFKVVYEFKTARSTLQGGSHNTKYEKLFMVK